MKFLALLLVGAAIGMSPLTVLAFVPRATERLVMIAPAPMPACPSYKWEI